MNSSVPPQNDWRSAAYVNLETYRRSGVPVQTPLWFVAHEGQLYLRTPVQAGKVKRLRHNPRVRVAPCDVRGHRMGHWQAGEAQVLDAAEVPWLHPLVLQKYGLLKRLMDWRSRLLGRRFVVIVVRLVA